MRSSSTTGDRPMRTRLYQTTVKPSPNEFFHASSCETAKRMECGLSAPRNIQALEMYLTRALISATDLASCSNMQAIRTPIGTPVAKSHQLNSVDAYH